MDKSVEEYVKRVLGLVDTEPLSILEATPGVLAEIVKATPPDRLSRKEKVTEWSPAEVLAHLSDSELVAAFRVRKMVSEPGSPIAAYDQLSWSRAFEYANRPPTESLRLFTSVREANVSLYRILTPEQWSAFGIHSERGRETVEQLVRLLAGHDRSHVAQINRMLLETSR